METELIVSSPGCSSVHDDADACRFQVAWTINPHMKPGTVNPARAIAQHAAFVARLRGLGASVTEVPFVHGAFDSVFAKDSALLIDRGDQRRALLATFFDARRQREQRARAAALRRQGFDVLGTGGHCLEGGDVAVLPSGAALMGYGFRTSRHAWTELNAFLEEPVLPLRLVDPWLYHLDTALAVLDDGTVLCCREAFDDASVRALERHPDIARLAFTPAEEARAFALNVVELDRGLVVTGTVAPKTEAALRALGRRVVHVNVSEFQLSGGSVSCLVSRVHGAARATLHDAEVISTSA